MVSTLVASNRTSLTTSSRSVHRFLCDLLSVTSAVTANRDVWLLLQEVLNMSRDEFSSLPSWKQTNLRKEAGLFWSPKAPNSNHELTTVDLSLSIYQCTQRPSPLNFHSKLVFPIRSFITWHTIVLIQCYYLCSAHSLPRRLTATVPSGSVTHQLITWRNFCHPYCDDDHYHSSRYDYYYYYYLHSVLSLFFSHNACIEVFKKFISFPLRSTYGCRAA